MATQFGTFVLALALAAAPAGLASAASPPQSNNTSGARATSASSHKRLSADDITLLLIGGASPQKMMVIIRQRGIDFALNPDLVKQFYQDGATDNVIDALQKASEALRSQPAGAPAPVQPAVAPAPASPPPPPAPSAHSAAQSAAQSGATPIATKPAASQPGAGGSANSGRAPSNSSRPQASVNQEASNAPLADPSPAQIQQIIQTFAAKEKLFAEARDNYTYHQINKVETLDADNNVNGVWEQDWDILYGANNKRIEQVTYAPESSLKGILITEQDLQSLRSIQPFVLTTDSLPEYDVQYMGHVHVDYITCYVFSVRPKELRKGHLYFKGVVWVDDHDLQIVKAEGRMVPQTKDNRFPRFTTWRQQIDGKYWFPTFTRADDTLYFGNGGPPVHIKEIIKYTDYKQFKSKFKILSSTPVSQNASTPPSKH